MNKFILLWCFFSGLFSSVVLANPCELSFYNALSLDKNQLIITNKSGESANISAHLLVINGDVVNLSAEQSRMLDAYRRQWYGLYHKTYSIAQATVDFGAKLLGDLGVSLGNKNAFTPLRDSMIKAYRSFEKQYIANGQLELPALTHQQLTANVAAELKKFQNRFNQEFLTNSFQLFSSSLEQAKTMDFNAFTQRMSTAKKQLDASFDKYAGLLKKDGEGLCQTLAELKIKEQKIQQSIRSLKGFNLLNPAQ